MSTLADPYPTFEPGAEAPDGVARLHQDRWKAPELRLALVHDDLNQAGGLISILVDGGVPPNTGVLPLDRTGFVVRVAWRRPLPPVARWDRLLGIRIELAGGGRDPDRT